MYGTTGESFDRIQCRRLDDALAVSDFPLVGSAIIACGFAVLGVFAIILNLVKDE